MSTLDNYAPTTTNVLPMGGEGVGVGGQQDYPREFFEKLGSNSLPMWGSAAGLPQGIFWKIRV